MPDFEEDSAAVGRDRDQAVGARGVEVGPFAVVGEADDARLVPADQAAAAGGRGVVADARGNEVGVRRVGVDRGLELDLAGLGVDDGDPEHLAGAVGELAAVVGELDPVALLDAQVVVAADAADGDRGRAAEGLDRGDDRGVLAGELEAGVGLGVADNVDLDAVELVLDAGIVVGRGDEAGVLGVLDVDRRGGEPGGRGGDELGPAGELRLGRGAGGVVADVGEQPHLPDGLPARGGIDAAEGGLEQVGIFRRRHLALPGDDIGQVNRVLAGQRVGRRPVRLRVVAHEVAGLGRDHLVEHTLGAGVALAGAVEDRVGKRRLRAGEVGRSVALDQHAVEIHPPAADLDAGACDADLEAVLGLARHDGAADGVDGAGADAALEDLDQLVPVGVEDRAALLQEDRREIAQGVEAVSAMVAAHRFTSLQVSKKSPASRPNRRYSSRRMRRLASRCGWKSRCQAPISPSSEAPRRISSGAERRSWA